MNPTPDASWKPDPQLLAAYFDGELEGRDDLADLRARLETYLDTHPEVIEEWAHYQQMEKAWQDTTPPEPSAAAWSQTLDRIEAERSRPTVKLASRRPWLAAWIVAASVLLVVGGLFGAWRFLTPAPIKNDPIVLVPQPKQDDVEVFPVASADEVVVRRIEGADTKMLPIGRMPVTGELELVGRGEVLVRYVRPNPDDQGMPQVIENNSSGPMIWGKLNSDE